MNLNISLSIMRTALLALLMSLSSAAIAAQQIGGLAIDYTGSMQQQVQEEQEMRLAFPPDVTRNIRSISIFGSTQRTNPGQVRIVRTTYAPGFRPSLEGAAAGSLKNVLALPGQSDVRHSTTRLTISGSPALHTVMTSTRFGGSLGSHFLTILDSKTNSIVQLQVIVGKRAERSGPPSIADEMQQALALVQSTTLIR